MFDMFLNTSLPLIKALARYVKKTSSYFPRFKTNAESSCFFPTTSNMENLVIRGLCNKGKRFDKIFSLTFIMFPEGFHEGLYWVTKKHHYKQQYLKARELGSNRLDIKIMHICWVACHTLNAKIFVIFKTSQLICRANQLTGFYMMATFTFNELTSNFETGRFSLGSSLHINLLRVSIAILMIVYSMQKLWVHISSVLNLQVRC